MSLIALMIHILIYLTQAREITLIWNNNSNYNQNENIENQNKKNYNNQNKNFRPIICPK